MCRVGVSCFANNAFVHGRSDTSIITVAYGMHRELPRTIGLTARSFQEAAMHLLGFLVFGLIIGLIARMIVPGTQNVGVVGTMLLGVGGSFLGGVVGNLLAGGPWNEPVTAGWIGSILGSIVLLMALGRSRSPIFRS